MGISTSHLILLLVIVLIVFGAGRVPQIMNDIGRGIKAFKSGFYDENNFNTTNKENSDNSKVSNQNPDYNDLNNNSS